MTLSPDSHSVRHVEPEATSSRPLESERSNGATAAVDQMSTLELVQVMNAEDARVAGAVARELPYVARAIDAIAARLRRGGRLIYLGAGTSGRLAALDAVECPPTFGVSPQTVVGCIAGGVFAWDTAQEDAEDRADLGEDDVTRLGVGELDAIVGVSASGHTPYVLGAISRANATGALTIGIACNDGTPLARLVQIAITPIVGPEVIAGSTRLKAGTAQKMILNMLSTGSMVRLGKTFGNLMVDVQATNAKLQQRATGIVAQATGLDLARAREVLAECDGEIKTAIVAQLSAIAPEAARSRLQAHDGIVRAALEGERDRRGTEGSGDGG